MNESIRERMLKAKSAHQQWLDEAKKLVADNNPDAVNAPVLHTSCEFGRWYYGDGQALKDKPEFQVIDNQHKEIHDLYMAIFNEVSSAMDPFAEEAGTVDKEKLKELEARMEEASGVLMQQLDALEQSDS